MVHWTRKMLDMPACTSRREVHQDGSVEVPQLGGAVWRGVAAVGKFGVRTASDGGSHAKPVPNRHPMNVINLGNTNALPGETGGADETGGYVGKMISQDWKRRLSSHMPAGRQ